MSLFASRGGSSRPDLAARFVTCCARWLSLLAPLCALESVAGAAQPSALPYAPQSQVNTTTAGYQGSPAVAALGAAGWIALWVDQGGGGPAIRVRHLERDGTPASGEWTLSTAPSTGSPELARLDDGRFVAVWPDHSAPLVEGNSPGIYARFLDSSGQPDGDLLTLYANNVTASDPDVEPGPGGGFVVSWHDFQDVWVRRFDASGAPLGPEQMANTLAGIQQAPRLARLDGGGGHVVAWTSWTSAGTDDVGSSVQWRRLAATGAFIGPEVQANSFISGHQEMPDVAALPGGGFAMVWRSVPAQGARHSDAPEGDPIGDGIDLRFFDSAGAPRAPEETVSLDAGPSVVNPAIRRAPDGDLLLVWKVASDAVIARRTEPRPHGFIGGELTIDDFGAASGLEYPKAGFDAEGDFAVVWESYGASPGGDASDGSVQLRSFTIGRVAHWRFEEGSGPLAFDAAGLDPDDATISGGGDPAWSWGRPGSGALAFAGDGFADVSPSFDLDITDAAVTLTAWVYLETLPSALAEPYASIYDAAEDNYVLYLDRDLAELRFKVTDSNGTAERPGIAQAMLPLRRWFHVAGVYRGDAATASIYLDGQLADAHVNPSLVDPVRSIPAQIVAIGRDGLNDRYYFDGRVDEIEVWRRGLSQAEIALARGPWIFGDGFERGDTLGWSSSQP